MKTASFAVPTRYQGGQPIPTSRLEHIQQLLLNRFGGYSVGPSMGKWSDQTGRVSSDKLVVYEIAYPEPQSRDVTELAKEIARIVKEPLYSQINTENLVFIRDDVHAGPVLPPVKEITPADWPDTFDAAIQTVIGPELQAVQDHFGIHPQKDVRALKGSLFYSGSIQSTANGLTTSVVVYCMGTAGNDSSAVAAERLINRWEPKVIFLLGIAAGRRRKCKIGDVVTPRLIVDDTLGVVEARKRLKRPRIYPPPHVMIQQLQNYRLDKEKWHRRLHNKIVPPNPPYGKAKEYREHVASHPDHHEAAIYSSNLLLRDQKVLETESIGTHQQIKIGEMEATGFSRACQEREIPVPWFVVRGVSDFGDDLKDDRFHSWASHSAAAYLAGLIEDGIRVDLLTRG